jgi:hypothetical protein
MGASIKSGTYICAIVPQPPVNPFASRARCGIQNNPHEPAVINRIKQIAK